MAIRSIELKNFTVFENIQCEFSPGINVFIGENGTGKTHLLKAMYAFCNTSTRESDIYDELRPLFNANPPIKGVIHRDKGACVRMTIHTQKGKNFFEIQANGGSQHKTEGTEPLYSTFIPAKEMLSISNITRINEKFDKELAIDKSLVNIITKAQNMMLSNPPELAKKIAPKLETIMDGTVFIKQSDNTFWIRKTNGEEIMFAMEAEGIRKFGLLWQLLMNESLVKGSVLFWDEPEANLNPKLIPILVDVLMELARNNVQIFLATHEYNLMKYFSVKKKVADQIAFISLRKTESGVASENQDDYHLLEHNSIVEANIKLLEDDIEGVL